MSEAADELTSAIAYLVSLNGNYPPAIREAARKDGMNLPRITSLTANMRAVLRRAGWNPPVKKTQDTPSLPTDEGSGFKW